MIQREDDPRTPVEVLPTARYVLLPLFERMTGYTQKAVRRKIEEGIWIEGRQYHRAPDGRIVMDMEAYGKWVVGQLQAESTQPEAESRSGSPGVVRISDRPSRSSRPQPT